MAAHPKPQECLLAAPRRVLPPGALSFSGILPIEELVESAESVWRPLGELLVDKGLVTEEELAAALAEQSVSGRLLGAILVERGLVSGPALASALAEQCGVELVIQGGFGTGLWAEISRRHRAGRGRPEPEDDNVVAFHPIRPPVLEAIPGPDPELGRLEVENRRLQDELERLGRELASVVEEPQPELGRLEVENRRLQDELERLGRELASVVEEPQPELGRLEVENRRLQDELERLGRELASVVEEPQPELGRLEVENRRLQDELERLGRELASVVQEPQPELGRLEVENRRLQDELERLGRELASVVQEPQAEPEPQPEPASHLLFIPTPARYLLAERDGPPPEPGAEFGVPEAQGRFVVARVGRAPFPAEPRPCAFLFGSFEQASSSDC